MFGLLKFEFENPGKINNEMHNYQAHYCGLCKMLASEYGQLSRFYTNYETTFMYLLLTAGQEKKNTYVKSRCPIAFSRKDVILTNELQAIADISIILFYEKVLDDEYDEKRKLPGFVKRSIQKKYLKAGKRLAGGGFDAGYIHCLMEKQRELEKQKINYLNVISEQTALMMAYIFKFISKLNPKTDQNLYIRLGYELGKWIYIMDSLVDYEKDCLSNQFNPIRLKCNFISQSPKINLLPDFLKKEIRQKLNNILLNIENTLSSIKINYNRPLIHETFIYSLEKKTRVVFEAMSNSSTNSRRNMQILQASVAGTLIPQAAFASNGLDQVCGSLIGPLMMCGILFYAFKTMFRCKTVPCCPCGSQNDSVVVEDGCGKKKVYKRGWDGKYRDHSSCC